MAGTGSQTTHPEIAHSQGVGPCVSPKADERDRFHDFGLQPAPTARNVAYLLVAELARSVRETMTSQHAESALSCVWPEHRPLFAVPKRVRGCLVLSLSLRTRLECLQGQPAADPARHATSSEAVTLSRTLGGWIPNAEPKRPGWSPGHTLPKMPNRRVKAVALASNFVYLRCRACAFLFVIDDRRSGVRPEHQRRKASRAPDLRAGQPSLLPAPDTQRTFVSGR